MPCLNYTEEEEEEEEEEKKKKKKKKKKKTKLQWKLQFCRFRYLTLTGRSSDGGILCR